EPGDANWAPAPSEPFAEAAAREPVGQLRIGLTFQPPLEGVKVDPACVKAARDAGMLLEELGHSVEEFAPPWIGLDLLTEFTRNWVPGVAMMVMIGGRIARRDPVESDVEPLTWTMWEHAKGLDTISYLGAEGRLE